MLSSAAGTGGVPTLPTRPYVVLELCHCATSVSSLEKLSSHGAAHLPSLSPQTMSHGGRLMSCIILYSPTMIFCHPVDENPPVLCSAQLHLKYCEGGENWLMFEVGEGNVKD